MPLPSKPLEFAADGRYPWERQPTEGQTRYKQFFHYLNQGPRRELEKVRERFAITRSSLMQYQRLYRWEERAQAYDRHMENQWTLALREHTKTMVQRHLLLAEKVRGVVMARLETIDPHKLTPTELVRLADLYSKATRTALGEPDQHIAVTGKQGAPPVQVTTIPGDEPTREAQMRAATVELAKRLGLEAVDLDAEAVLELPQ